jgi:MscS family membrane protein
MPSDWMTQPGIAGNTPWQVLYFFGVILLALVVGGIARFILERAARREEKRREWLGVVMHSLAAPAVFVCGAVGLWFAIDAQILNTTAGFQSVLDTASSVLFAVAIGHAVFSQVKVVDHFLMKWASRSESKVDDMLVPLVGKSVRFTVAILVILQIVESLSDKPITSILAGLGVGGLAVALAGQDTIKNFFGSLVIVADKPFEIGDRIIFDGHDGPVETVGFRSTKIRTLDGHLVTVPNSELVNKSVQNVGKRPYIKRLANIQITYDTPPEKVRKAVAILKEILDNHEGMNEELPPRVFFNEFNEWSLNLIMIYWYHPPDYMAYLDFTERVNHEILQRFNEEKIEFAFPTQTIHVQGNSDTE